LASIARHAPLARYTTARFTTARFATARSRIGRFRTSLQHRRFSTAASDWPIHDR
jgi:hypothetical protein